MPRWIAFDQQTSSLLRSTLAQGTNIVTFGSGAVEYALAKPGAVVTLMPAGSASDIGIAVFRPQPQRTQARQRKPAGASASAAKTHSPTETVKSLYANTYFAKTTSGNVFATKPSFGKTQAGGFLGLRDEVVLEDEPEPEKKGWWRRFWDD